MIEFATEGRFHMKLFKGMFLVIDRTHGLPVEEFESAFDAMVRCKELNEGEGECY